MKAGWQGLQSVSSASSLPSAAVCLGAHEGTLAHPISQTLHFRAGFQYFALAQQA